VEDGLSPRFAVNFRLGVLPISIHFSFFLGALLFSRFKFRPGLWCAFGLVVLVHEIGHALLVRRYRMRITHVMVHGFGGECAYLGRPTPYQSAVIAWGGVWAQAALFVLALLASRFLPTSLAAWRDGDFMRNLLWPNVQLMALNLLPIPPLDGSRAWSLLPMLSVRWRRSWQASQEADRIRREAQATLSRLDALDNASPSKEEEDEIDRFIKRSIERGAKGAKKTDS
jgi:stage IV sporulation protein FB